MEKLNDHPIILMAKGQGQKAQYTPVWFMRQAGRYQKSYREIRGKVSSFWDLVKNPDLAAKITLLPIKEFDFDAAILFSDILTILEPFGFNIEFKNGIKITPCLYDLPSEKIKELVKIYDVATNVDYVYEAIKKILSKLDDRPLIGFSGAPFTLALYLIEGGSTKKYEKVRIFMHTRKEDFHYIMNVISKVVENYLENQIKAGVHLVQIFDSWAGILSEKEYQDFVFPYTDRVIKNLKVKYKDIPIIHFGFNTYHLVSVLKDLNADVLGVDHLVCLNKWIIGIENKMAVQGNLENIILYLPWEKLKIEVEKIIQRGLIAKGHIFNLGHGILPTTPEENVKKVVKYIKEYSKALRGI